MVRLDWCGRHPAAPAVVVTEMKREVPNLLILFDFESGNRRRGIAASSVSSEAKTDLPQIHAVLIGRETAKPRRSVGKSQADFFTVM
jgi:hypothetical protein